MYSLTHVSKRYGASTILHELNCEIPASEFVVVLGASGAGKSTLLRLLSFVEEPTSGVVVLTLPDRDYSSTSADRPWPRVTTVFQKHHLWPHLTVRENILLPLLSQRNRSEEDANLVIELFNMNEFLHRYPNEISGGEAQRAALARALVLNPDVIIIDEAHAGLDLLQQAILNSYLSRLRQTGIGLIVVTHSIEFAKKYASKVIVLEDGVITEIGDKEVFNLPKSTFLRKVLGASEALS